MLSLAAEKTKAWYDRPETCPELQSKASRKTRSERREAIIVVLEALLKHMDLATLQMGMPSKNGFIDLDMSTIVKESGLNQRRCERAIAQLKVAGFINVRQPRVKRSPGVYAALRAIRVFTKEFFIWLGLDGILYKEKTKAMARSGRKFAVSIKQLYGRTIAPTLARPLKPDRRQSEFRHKWTQELIGKLKQGMEMKEAQKELNLVHRLPLDWSPGKSLPEYFKINCDMPHGV